MSRPLLFRALALTLGLSVAIVAAEVGIRALGLGYSPVPEPQWQVRQGDTWRHWKEAGHFKQASPYASVGVTMGEYKPNTTFRTIYADNPRGYFDADNAVEMQINADGHRGPVLARPKPPNTVRVLGLGDSFTFGLGVRQEDTFLRKLEAQLQANPPDDRAYEVLNAGVQGHNTRDEVVYLQHKWLAWQPDAVVIVFYLNDAYKDDAFVNEAVERFRFQPTGMAQYSAIAELVQFRQHAAETHARFTEYTARPFFSAPEAALDANPGVFDWRNSRAALAFAAELGQQRGLPVGVVIFPELLQLDEDYPFAAVHTLVADTAEELGMPVLDLFDAFNGQDASAMWAHSTDHHPNEVAHGIAARAIDPWLRETLLKAPAASAAPPADPAGGR